MSTWTRRTSTSWQKTAKYQPLARWHVQYQLLLVSMHAVSLQTQNISAVIQSSVSLPNDTGLPSVSMPNTGTNIPCTELQPIIKCVNECSAPEVGMMPIYSCLNPNVATYVRSHTGYNSFIRSLTSHIQDHSVNELARIFQQQMYISQLPPPEPGIFLGDPIQFPEWLTSFELLTESRQITAAERLHYLKL